MRDMVRIRELEIGPKPVVVLDRPRRRVPRLLELGIAGWLGEAPSELILLVESDAVHAEIAIHPRDGGPLQTLVDLGDRPVARISIRGADGMPTAIARDFALSPVSQLDLLRQAFKRAPDEAAGALYWRLRGQRTRARNRLMRCVAPLTGLDYGAWLAGHEPRWRAELTALEQQVRAAGAPRLAVLLPTADDGADAEKQRASVVQQAYPDVEIVEGEPGTAIAAASAEWIVLLCDGDRLAPGALWRLAAAIVAHPGAQVIYGDHDVVDEAGRRRDPAFKPGWNPPLFLATDYVGAFAVRRSAAVRATVQATAGSDTAAAHAVLIWQVAATGDAAATVRLPRILTHQSPGCAARRRQDAALAARAGALQPLLGDACTLSVERRGLCRVHFAVPAERPLVSMVVPTRDRLDLLEPCIDTLLGKTLYRNFEIIVADNDSRKARTLAYLRNVVRDRRVRVVPAPGPFNLSVINNRMATQARGDILAFVNNDVEVIAPEWLDEMVGPALLPGIGAVGAKLLYESGLVQHAGVALGVDGAAGHVHRFFGGDEPGYMNRLQVPALFSAVTTAVALVTRAKFEAVGGFDEVAFPAAFNDVDLGLKLLERGWPSYWTPYAVLRHKESASRAHEASPEQRAASARIEAAFRARWGHLIGDDPYYNPNLLSFKPDARSWPA